MSYPMLMGRGAFKKFLKEFIEFNGLEYNWRNLRRMYTWLTQDQYTIGSSVSSPTQLTPDSSEQPADTQISSFEPLIETVHI